MKMNKKTSFVLVYWWVLILFIIAVALVIYADKEEQMSESEKRMLSGFPDVSVQSVLSGDFSSGFESFLSDKMFARDDVVGLSNGLISCFSVNTEEDIQLLEEMKMSDELQGISNDSNKNQDGENSGSQDDTLTEDGANQIDVDSNFEAELNGEVQESEEMIGYGLWLKTVEGKFKMFAGVSEDKIKQVSETLNQYRSFLPEDGNVFYLYVPLTNTSNIIVESKKYNGWHDNVGEGVAKYADSGVHYISAANVVEDGLLNGEHMYYRSDHHWTPRAAVKAVNECLKIQGIPDVAFDEYEYKVNTFVNSEKHTRDDLELLYPLQDVYGSTMIDGEKDKVSDLIKHGYYTYVAFLSGDTRNWEKYETGFSVGRNALVIGDSFSNVFTVYLMPYYDEVNKADIRYFDAEKSGLSISELIEENNIDDVYIVVSHANGFESKNSYDRLEKILYGE